MKIQANKHIDNLIQQTLKQIKIAQEINKLAIEKLNHKPNINQWSVLECFEHLNLYSNYYLPVIENSILKSKHLKADFFKPGVFGNYFTKLMEPKSKNKNMKTAKSKNPNNSKLNKKVIIRFLNHQQKLIDLLTQAKAVNINKTKTSISITKLIKLKLGDTFSFIIAHNKRHLQQAKNALR